MEKKVASVGADVHRTFSRLTMRDANAKRLWGQRLEHQDRQQLRRELRRLPAGTPVILEATFGWSWFSDEVAAAGLVPLLSHSGKVDAWRKARSLAKSNRLDADLLSELWFEKTHWWRVWLAPPAVRDQREWMRHRSSLVGMQTQVKNRIHALLHRHGVLHEYSDLFGVAGRKFLGQLCRNAQGRLSDGAVAGLKGNLAMLAQLRHQVAVVNCRLRRGLGPDELAGRLMSIPGIGLILSHTLMAEIGEISRFRSHHALAAYSLLAPLAADTGEERPDKTPAPRRIGTRGNHTLKWAFIEAAHAAVSRGGRWRQIFHQHTDGGKKDRHRGYIAVARQLVKVVYVVWSKAVCYTDSPPPRPGSEAARRGPDPGTGQLCAAMVAVPPKAELQASV